MIVHPAHWRRAQLAAIRFCVTLAALALAAVGATAATAAAAAASGSGSGPVVTTDDGAVRGVTAGTVDEFLGIPYAALVPSFRARWP